VFVGRVAMCVLLAGVAMSSAAQRLYKYRNEHGEWVFTDRPPASGEPYETSTLNPSFEAPELRVYRRDVAGGIALIADNRYYCPIEIAFQLASMDNLPRDTPWSGDRVLPPRSQTELLRLEPEDPKRTIQFQYNFQYIPGDPTARHAPHEPYRLPYALARSFHVSQAAPDQITHLDAASAYAIDFVMPVGTPIYAARGGTVIDVASDFFGAGLDPATDGPRANIVRILHDDGTMALYAHLNWNSIRVEPGQDVERGEYLADSGNTGFSTGPHLHFVVQVNDHGAIVSVPVEFAGPGGAAQTLHTGDTPTAY
jgi:Peptidase family M23/Domain of unknown function (DUF4124)